MWNCPLEILRFYLKKNLGAIQIKNDTLRGCLLFNNISFFRSKKSSLRPRLSFESISYTFQFQISIYFYTIPDEIIAIISQFMKLGNLHDIGIKIKIYNLANQQ